MAGSGAVQALLADFEMPAGLIRPFLDCRGPVAFAMAGTEASGFFMTIDMFSEKTRCSSECAGIFLPAETSNPIPGRQSAGAACSGNSRWRAKDDQTQTAAHKLFRGAFLFLRFSVACARRNMGGGAVRRRSVGMVCGQRGAAGVCRSCRLSGRSGVPEGKAQRRRRERRRLPKGFYVRHGGRQALMGVLAAAPVCLKG